MGYRLPHPCGTPGCPHPATYRGRCAEHASRVEAERNVRRWESRSVYTSTQWRTLRLKILRFEPYCRGLDGKRCGWPATEVDHITPIAAGGNPFDLDNLQPLCKSCHSTKTAREGRVGPAEG